MGQSWATSKQAGAALPARFSNESPSNGDLGTIVQRALLGMGKAMETARVLPSSRFDENRGAKVVEALGDVMQGPVPASSNKRQHRWSRNYKAF